METKKTDSLEFYNLCNYLSRMRRRKIFVKTKADGGPELLKKKKNNEQRNWATMWVVGKTKLLNVYNNYNA